MYDLKLHGLGNGDVEEDLKKECWWRGGDERGGWIDVKFRSSFIFQIPGSDREVSCGSSDGGELHVIGEVHRLGASIDRSIRCWAMLKNAVGLSAAM